MARFVPARPLPDLDPDMRAPLFAAEDFLDDIHVVIQPVRGEPGAIVHPDSGIFAIVSVPGIRRLNNPAKEVWVRSDGSVFDVVAAAAAAAARIAARIGVKPEVVAGIVHVPGRPAGESGERVVTGQGDALGDVVLGAIQRLATIPIGNKGVQLAIDRLSPVPGGSPYVPNQITPQQEAWREERSQEAFEQDLMPARILKVDDERLMRFAEAVVRHATEGREARMETVSVSLADLADPQRFLPAFLVVASDIAAPIVAKHHGRGGFQVSLVSDDEDALLGYRVTRISSSTPLLMMLALSDAVRRTAQGEEVALEAVNHHFRRFLRRNSLDHRIADDADVRLATEF